MFEALSTLRVDDEFTLNLAARELYESIFGFVTHPEINSVYPQSLSLGFDNLSIEFYDPFIQVSEEFMRLSGPEKTGLDIISFQMLPPHQVSDILTILRNGNNTGALNTLLKQFEK